MPVPLIVSIAIAIACVFIFMYGYLQKDKDMVSLSLFIFMLLAIFGFGVICSAIPVNNKSTIYHEPESIFQDEKYLVAVYGSQAYLTGEARYLLKYKEGIIKVSEIQKTNSYGVVVSHKYALCGFSKEEWEKIEKAEVNKP